MLPDESHTSLLSEKTSGDSDCEENVETREIRAQYRSFQWIAHYCLLAVSMSFFIASVFMRGHQESCIKRTSSYCMTKTAKCRLLPSILQNLPADTE